MPREGERCKEEEPSRRKWDICWFRVIEERLYDYYYYSDIRGFSIHHVGLENVRYIVGEGKKKSYKGGRPALAPRMPAITEDAGKLRPQMRHYCQGVH